MSDDYILLFKISQDGRVLWANKIHRRIPSLYESYLLLHKIRTDHHNNTYLVGTVERPEQAIQDVKDSLSIGSTNIVLQKRMSPFIAKLSPEGEFVWNHLFDVELQNFNLEEATIFGIFPRFSYPFAFDYRPGSSSSMVFAGIFRDDATFPTTPPSSLQGNHDIFVFTTNLEKKNNP